MHKSTFYSQRNSFHGPTTDPSVSKMTYMEQPSDATKQQVLSHLSRNQS